MRENSKETIDATFDTASIKESNSNSEYNY